MEEQRQGQQRYSPGLCRGATRGRSGRPGPATTARLARMAGLDDARAKGASAVDAVRVSLAERAAELLRRDPELTDTAVEVGLVDRAWLEEPGQHPVRTAPALDVVQRFLERSVERRPSALGLDRPERPAAPRLATSRSPSGDGAPTPVAIVFTDLEGFTRFTSRHGRRGRPRPPRRAPPRDRARSCAAAAARW